MATTVTGEQVAVRSIGTRWMAALAAFALVAVLAAAVALIRQGPVQTPTSTARVDPIYTADELTVIDLVARGVLPDEVLLAEPFRTKQLVAEGVLPQATLETRPAPVTSPLWCPEERAVIAAVAAGVIPKQVLEGEPFRTKRLINQGLIPRGAASPC